MYNVIAIDLTNVQANDVEVAQPKRRIKEAFFMDIPSGATLQLRLGQSNPLLPISRPVTFEPDGEDEANNGVYWQNNAAQPGVIVYLVVVYGTSTVAPVLT